MDELIERAKVVKARWSMESLITALTGDIVPASRKIISIFNPDEQHASMHVYDDHFHDFSTGKSGDVIELIRLVKHLSFEDAIGALEDEADDLKLPVEFREPVVKPQFVMPTVSFTGPLPEPLPGVSQWSWAYLFNSRSLGLVEGDVAIIHRDWSTGIPIGVKYRGCDGAKYSEPGSEFTRSLYWVHREPDAKQCVLMEGESDLWAWTSQVEHHFAQPQLFALPSGASSWKDEWLNVLLDYDSVFICMDNDAAGIRARDKIALKVGYGRAEFVVVPPQYNDVREAVIHGWKPPKIG